MRNNHTLRKQYYTVDFDETHGKHRSTLIKHIDYWPYANKTEYDNESGFYRSFSFYTKFINPIGEPKCRQKRNDKRRTAANTYYVNDGLFKDKSYLQCNHKYMTYKNRNRKHNRRNIFYAIEDGRD